MRHVVPELTESSKGASIDTEQLETDEVESISTRGLIGGRLLAPTLTGAERHLNHTIFHAFAPCHDVVTTETATIAQSSLSL
jgi:hypothetical protein